jgi:hypothetical protein
MPPLGDRAVGQFAIPAMATNGEKADGEWHLLGRGEEDLRYPGDRSHCQQVCAGLESSTAPAMSLPSGRK